MKNKIIIILGVIFIIISKFLEPNEPDINLLPYINSVNTLEILTIDAKCGEWGGNQKIITVYRDGFKGQLLADYSEKTMTCNTGLEPKDTKSIKRIKLTENESDLIIDYINELSKHKLINENIPSHSGFSNRIMLKDSSIIINGFPSVELESFNKLISELIKK